MICQLYLRHIFDMIRFDLITSLSPTETKTYKPESQNFLDPGLAKPQSRVEKTDLG